MYITSLPLHAKQEKQLSINTSRNHKDLLSLQPPLFETKKKRIMLKGKQLTFRKDWQVQRHI